MEFKDLIIVSHLKHYRRSNGVYSYEPYVREIVYWAKLFDSISIYSEISTSKEVFALAKLPENVKVFDIGYRSGPGIMNNLIRILQIPKILLKVWTVYIKAEVIHTRSAGIPTMAVNLFNLIWNKPTIEKWATNAPPDKGLGIMTNLNYRLLAYSPSRTRVFAYAPVENNRFALSFPALFSNRELERFGTFVDKGKWLNASREFVCVSRLHRDKNVQLVMNAILKGIITDALTKKFKVTLVGGGPLEEEIRTFISEKDLSRNVQMCGNLPFEKALEVMAKSHFLIMPGINEGWGKVINEALSVDCVPLVVKGGNAENVMRRMEIPGLLFDNSSDDLINTITKAMNISNQQVAVWLENGHKYNRKFTLEKYMQIVKSTYEEIY